MPAASFAFSAFTTSCLSSENTATMFTMTPSGRFRFVSDVSKYHTSVFSLASRLSGALYSWPSARQVAYRLSVLDLVVLPSFVTSPSSL